MINQEHVMKKTKPPIENVLEIDSCKTCLSLHHPLGIPPKTPSLFHSQA